MIDYKNSKNKKFRCLLVISDNFSKCLWAIPPKNSCSQTITQDFSNILTQSKRSLVILESDRGAEWYNSTFRNFLKNKNSHHYSRFTDKGPSKAERVIRTISNLLRKPLFEKGNADWISELTSVIKKNNNTIHSSIKMTPEQTSEKTNEKNSFQISKTIENFKN